ncbi:MAG TPA: transcriptional repressor LexA [Vicinamibacterales bacterium]|nr:transcriptional repressor LexA [Vicinamibacterales bacterium]
MPLDQHTEGVAISLEARFHQLGIGRVRDRHFTAGFRCPLPCACNHALPFRLGHGAKVKPKARRRGLTFAFSLHIVRIMLPLTKRQREILDYLNDFIQQHGYAPSLEEIGRRFGLSSLATVHKHLTNLQEKGFIKRAWNRSRSVELVSSRVGGRAVELPLLGFVAAGQPIEAIVGTETIAVPEDLVGKRDTYVLRVKGDSMIDEQIRDGDYVIVEDRRTADNGEMVIALLNGSDVTLKRLYREQGHIRLQPANPAMQPIIVQADQVQIQGVVIGVMRRY